MHLQLQITNAFPSFTGSFSVQHSLFILAKIYHFAFGFQIFVRYREYTGERRDKEWWRKGVGKELTTKWNIPLNFRVVHLFGIEEKYKYTISELPSYIVSREFMFSFEQFF